MVLRLLGEPWAWHKKAPRICVPCRVINGGQAAIVSARKGKGKVEYPPGNVEFLAGIPRNSYCNSRT